MDHIVYVEAVGGGERADCCNYRTQTIDDVNLKIVRRPGGPGNIRRYRLCDRCAKMLLEDLARALKRTLEKAA